LRGGSVLDWHRLNLDPEDDARSICAALGIDIADPDDVAMVERIRDEAVAYLREAFDFPVPAPVARAALPELLLIAASTGNRHRQLCACTLLKTMHVINHFDASEARQALELTDQELFRMAEQRIYRVVSGMMAEQLPVVEFMGGRKQRASMLTKLLSKADPLSAQLFDKMRFRVVTATRDDIIPTIAFLSRNLFPFNHVLSKESYNSLFPFISFCRQHPHLSGMVDRLQLDPEIEDRHNPLSNRHSSPNYRVVHWVVDMPLQLGDHVGAFRTDGLNPVPRPLIYVRAELQILDRKTHRQNERGDASHRRYKDRQRAAVAERLKLGARRFAAAGSNDDDSGELVY
ncbi:MAG TPA: TIGR04552 family protein, partial [Polyangia bacterium]|nr:TIGR04552 family protein [Polyangia bacterium]